MVKVGIHCFHCGEQFSIQISIGHAMPRWAMRLWKAALKEGWTRRRQDHAVFCPNCKTQSGAPSERIIPLHPIRFVTVLECDACGTQYEGDDAIFETHFNRDIRNSACQLEGWRYTSLDRNRSYHDFCPDCWPEVTRNKRESLMRMVWSRPTRTAALDLGISDKAIEKQCKRWMVPKPPRGFWAKWHAGHIEDCRALIPEKVAEILGDEFLNEIYPLSG